MAMVLILVTFGGWKDGAVRTPGISDQISGIKATLLMPDY
jgi:hypothetical protein